MLQQTLHILIHKQIYKDKKTCTHTYTHTSRQVSDALLCVPGRSSSMLMFIKGAPTQDLADIPITNIRQQIKADTDNRSDRYIKYIKHIYMHTICNFVIYIVHIVNTYINNYDKVPIKFDTCDC